jgi:hypothetical protein
MIRLSKGPKPRIVVHRGSTWTADYVQRSSAGSARQHLPAHYRHAEIKAALRLECHDKCMYCETRVSHSQYGDIDHQIPVSLRPDLVVDWLNLGYSCEKCNNNKGDYWDEHFPLVNPYIEDPSQFLTFAGPMILPRPGNLRGKLTIERIDLNRNELIAQRKERLERIIPLVDQVALMPAGMPRNVMMSALRKEMNTAVEYSATIAAYLTPFLQSSTVRNASP